MKRLKLCFDALTSLLYYMIEYAFKLTLFSDIKSKFCDNNNKIDIVNSLILLFSIVFSIVKKKYVKN
jgi:hypothetical protein